MACLTAPSKPLAQHVALMLHCKLQRRRCLCEWSWPHLASIMSSLQTRKVLQTIAAESKPLP